MQTLIIGGGDLTPGFLTEFMTRTKIDFIIAADRGMECLAEAGISPNLILGDYDSTDPVLFETLRKRAEEQHIDLLTYPAEKDFSDMEAAMHEAVKRGSDGIWILGATGGRLDHFLSTLLNLEIGLRKGIPSFLMDEQNLVCLADQKVVLEWKKEDETLRFCFSREGMEAQEIQLNRKPHYLSFLPMSETVTNLTLTGTKYPLRGHDIGHMDTSLTISNEMAEDRVEAAFDSGVLAVMMTDDQTFFEK